MAGIIIPIVDITNEPNPPDGTILIATDLGGQLTTKDSNGSIISGSSSGGSIVYTITNADNNGTASAVDSIIFVTFSTFGDYYLPNPVSAFGKKITFIKQDPGYESGITIYGNYYDGNTFYSIYQPGLVLTVVCDGTVWYANYNSF